MASVNKQDRRSVVELDYKRFNASGEKMARNIVQSGGVPPEGLEASGGDSATPVVVQQPQHSGSTISNFDLEVMVGLQPGSEEWLAKKEELRSRLQQACKRREDLKEQLAIQAEKLRLEQQENETRRLEAQLKAEQEAHNLNVQLQTKVEEVQAIYTRETEERKIREQEFRKQYANLVADFERRESELQHELELIKAQKQLESREEALRAELRELVGNQPQVGELTKGAIRDIPRRAQAEATEQWCNNTAANNSGTAKHVTFEPSTVQTGNMGLDTAGTNILDRVGLESDMANYIVSQAGLAKSNNPTGMATTQPGHGQGPTGGGAPAAANIGPRTGALVNPGAVPNPMVPIVEQTADLSDEGESDTSSITCTDKNKKTKKKKSGMIARPSHNVKTQEVWPHFNLAFGFVSSNVTFNDLTYEQYIAGEVRTIIRAKDPIEKQGRLLLMERFAYLKHRGYQWKNLKALYAHIVKSIEMHDGTWASEWRGAEDIVLDRRGGETNFAGRKSSNDWFCRNFNSSSGCELESPHEAVINKKKRQVKHFCARCYNKESQVKLHSQMEDICPHKA